MILENNLSLTTIVTIPIAVIAMRYGRISCVISSYDWHESGSHAFKESNRNSRNLSHFRSTFRLQFRNVWHSSNGTISLIWLEQGLPERVHWVVCFFLVVKPFSMAPGWCTPRPSRTTPLGRSTSRSCSWAAWRTPTPLPTLWASVPSLSTANTYLVSFLIFLISYSLH